VLRKDMHAPLVNQKLYRLIVGSFLFATNSWPWGIQFVVSVFNWHLSSRTSYGAIKNILRYLKGTKHLSLHFPSKGEDFFCVIC
jgi:ABC-type sugar transport system permease subunit